MLESVLSDIKAANNEYPILDLLKSRWSPRAFTNQAVESETLFSLFEAARWSPSANNSQPWNFLFTRSNEPKAHAKMIATLRGFNQVWASNAPVLILANARVQFEDGKTNPFGLYDLGQSVAHLSIEASHLGVHVHQMGGFDSQKARETFAIPVEYQPVTLIAVGYLGQAETLPDELRTRELQPRTRKHISEFVFEGEWGKSIK